MQDKSAVSDIQPYDSEIISKGTFISGGGTGIVERLPSGDVVKSPWTDNDRQETCRADLCTEWKIYQRLGTHPRLVKIKDWNDKDCTLTMECIEHGPLDEYLCNHRAKLTPERQRIWVHQIVDVVAHFHSRGVIHCDLETRNCLVDDNLNLRVIDFAGSSIDGRLPSALVAPAFLAPDVDVNTRPTVQHDLFSLGGLIYNIVTGDQPFRGKPSGEIRHHYRNGNFPCLDDLHLQFREIIDKCWNKGFGNAHEIVTILAHKEHKTRHDTA